MPSMGASVEYDTLDSFEAMSSLLVEQVEAVWSALLHSCTTPNREKRLKRMERPQVGDLVWIWLTLNARPQDVIGFLLSVDMLPIHAEGDWDEKEDGPRPLYKHWRIRTLDGREMLWHNVQPLRVERKGDSY